jgi:hypothetical protein
MRGRRVKEKKIKDEARVGFGTREGQRIGLIWYEV